MDKLNPHISQTSPGEYKLRARVSFPQAIIGHRFQDGDYRSEQPSKGVSSGRKIVFVRSKADCKRSSAWPLA
jgi:hypothetical protein